VGALPQKTGQFPVEAIFWNMLPNLPFPRLILMLLRQWDRASLPLVAEPERL